MPRRLPRSTRRLPWLLLLEAAVAAGAHVRDRLSARDRERLRHLVTKSKGRPSNLSERERMELRHLMRQLDLPGLGRQLAPLRRRHRR